MDAVPKLSNIAAFAQVQAARGGALQAQIKRLQGEKSDLSPLRETREAKALHAAPAAKTGAAKEAELKKTCDDFESIFWNFVLKSMRDATPKTGFLDSSQEQEIFTSMQDDELSKSFAQKGGLGISRMMFEQLKKTL